MLVLVMLVLVLVLVLVHCVACVLSVSLVPPITRLENSHLKMKRRPSS